MKRGFIIAFATLIAVASMPLLNTVSAKQKKEADSDVNWITDSDITEVHNFSESLARFKKGARYGFMDKAGTVVIEPKYFDAGDFSEGLARVNTGTFGYAIWGYIDKTGNSVIPQKYGLADDFHEGLAGVWTNYEGSMFIDKTGKAVIKNDYLWSGSFSNGMARVQEKPLIGGFDIGGQKYGFIDNTGKVVIKIRFDYVDDFHEGLAYFSDGSKRGYIDTRGNVVIEPQYDLTGNFSNGLAYVRDFTGKSFYIDKTGKQYSKNEIDAGKFRVPGASETGTLCEGLVKFKKGNFYGYADSTGKEIIEPVFWNAGDFSEGMAVVDRSRKKGLLANPLKGENREKALIQTGQLLGEVKSVSARDVMIGGSGIGEKVFMGDRLMLYSGDDYIILRASFPMMTTVKCDVITGSIKDIKPNMKVYRYTGIKKLKENK